MNIAIQYGKINHPVQAGNLLDQAWNLTDKAGEGLDSEEMFEALVGAYGECGLFDKGLLRVKSFPDNYELLTLVLQYSRNKQPEDALNILRDFKTKIWDQMKAGAIGDIIDQLSTSNKEEEMRVLAGAVEILDSIPDKDWKYLIGLKNEDYLKITLKYIGLNEYDQALQIINQKVQNYDDKVSISVKAVLIYIKLNKEINKNREDFIKQVSDLT